MRNRIVVECDNCGAEKETDPIHEGEKHRITRCPECGEYFTVYSTVS